MNKRYQVFVSSTYADLREERSRVIQTLMEMDCIPAGMELFPAADEDQLEFIKKVIDDCDYYLLIIGGRYGSTTSEGVSFTEKEYDYAIAKGLRVVALLHQEPDSIAVGKTDRDAELAKRLAEFRQKVQTGRLVKYWCSAGELPGIVALSLTKTIKTYPAAGWVRGNATASAEVLDEMNQLRKENAELKAALSSMSIAAEPQIGNIAGLDGEFSLMGDYRTDLRGQTYRWKATLTFGEYFALIGPRLFEHPNDLSVNLALAKDVVSSQRLSSSWAQVDDQLFQTLKVQLQALGLIELRYTETTKGGMALFWSLTKLGTATLLQLRVVRTA